MHIRDFQTIMFTLLTAAILALLLAINGGCTSVTNVFYGDVEVSPDVIMGK